MKSMKTVWKTACREAGLVGITPHMLRHTFASWLRMPEVDIETMSKLAGHRDVQTKSSYYSHLGNSYLLSKMNKIGEIFPLYRIGE
jgi:integrase